MSVVNYHNPRCTKSRQTLALLDARGTTPKVVDYLKTPPIKTKLERILKLLEIVPRALTRRKELKYEHAGLDNHPTLNDGEKQSVPGARQTAGRRRPTPVRCP